MVGLPLFVFFLGKNVAHLTQNNAELQKIDLFSYSRNGFE